MQISEEMAILIFLGVVAYVVVRYFLQNAINKRKPKVESQVKVVKINDKYSGVIYFGRRGGINLSPEYIITFKFKNGKKKIFYCPSPEYEWVKLKDEGILTHQGTQFISFEKRLITEHHTN